MAAVIGKNGSVKVSKGTSGTSSIETIAYVDSFSLNPSVETIDITAYGSTWRSRISGLRDWSGSFNLTLDRTDSGQLLILTKIEGSDSGGSDLAMRFYTTSVAYWGGTVIPTGFTVNSNVADKVTLSVNFQGNGALSYTAAGS